MASIIQFAQSNTAILMGTDGEESVENKMKLDIRSGRKQKANGKENESESCEPIPEQQIHAGDLPESSSEEGGNEETQDNNVDFENVEIPRAVFGNNKSQTVLLETILNDQINANLLPKNVEEMINEENTISQRSLMETILNDQINANLLPKNVEEMVNEENFKPDWNVGRNQEEKVPGPMCQKSENSKNMHDVMGQQFGVNDIRSNWKEISNKEIKGPRGGTNTDVQGETTFIRGTATVINKKCSKQEKANPRLSANHQG
ncbi:hypothetical protein L6452_34043 [Arctium lappa]|uniref:Uncharacterized protein n=1 Tax=Arctium lappa TaxID=4217 RepID=A0ACB8YGI3_ARCLA|nr:hypothetical protein L6452_34043 [Arctium lappa]